MSAVGLLLLLVFVAVSLWIVKLLVGDPKVRQALFILIVLAGVLWLLQGFGLLNGAPIRFGR